MTVATFGAGSVAGTIAISSAITLASKTAEVTALQIKKSKNDGDSSGEIFSDVVDSIFGNGGKIIGLTILAAYLAVSAAPILAPAGAAAAFAVTGTIRR